MRLLYVGALSASAEAKCISIVSDNSLKTKTANGLLWGGISQGGQQLLNLIFGIFLARLLTAEDYGIVGMLTIFTLIANSLQESGFISALNRKEKATDADFNAVFWFNVLMALSIYAQIGRAHV